MGNFTPQFDEARKIYTMSYQPKDEDGLPIGRAQSFEAPTLEELTGKIAAAHSSASSLAYKERKARKLGDLIDTDPAQPLYNFEGRTLTADERTKLAKELNNPATMSDALDTMLEAKFGAPLSVIRQKLQYAEVRERIDLAEQETLQFLAANSDYYPDPNNLNKRDMLKWLEKKNLAMTKKNLEAAFKELKEDLIQRPLVASPLPANASVSSAAPAGGNPPAAASTEPLSSGGDPATLTTTATGNPGDASAARPATQAGQATRTSSTGLSARGTAPAPANAAAGPHETIEITAEEINNLSSVQYAERMRDPKFLAAVEKLYAKK